MKQLLLIFAGILFFIDGFSQKLGLPDAIEIALKNNLGIQVAKNNAVIAGINNSYGIAGGLPLVTMTGTDNQQITTINQKYSDPTKDATRSGVTSNNLSAGLNASELIFNGKRVVSAKRRLSITEEQSKQIITSKALALVYNVILKYYDVVKQQSYARTLGTSIEVSRQKLEIVKAQQKVGVANNADLFQAQVDLNTQLQALEAQQLNIDQDITDLLTLLTLRPDSTVVIEDTILVDKNIQFKNIMDGIANNPDIVAANQQVSINQYLVKEVTAQRYPTLSFGAGYNLNRNQNAAGFSLLNQNYGPYAGLTLFVPIFNGGIYRKQQEIATINTRSADLLKDTLILSYTSNAVKNWQAYTNNLEQLEMSRQNYELSKKLLELVLQRFQLKQATIVDVKNAQQSFELAGFLLTNISFSAKSAEVQLKRLANQLTQ
ncbi:MAG TPA: TolC family protein [Puia sp.]|nr:TolC family protein [Puia sp.]